MTKNLFFVVSILLLPYLSFGQISTKTFEDETHASTNFTDNGVVFNIISHVGWFHIQANYPGTGWNGTTFDNRYIDNSSGTVTDASFSIVTTSNLFKVKQFWLYLADNFLNLTVPGTLTITGKLGGVEQFNELKTSGFVTSVATNNGYTLIDLSNLNGHDNSNILIDELVITLGGAYMYAGLDAFTWEKTSILPVTFGSIKASVKNKVLHVNWKTESEVNNDRFEIEASKDGKSFTTIAVVPTKAINNNSDTLIEYEWTSTSSLSLVTIPFAFVLFVLLLFLKRKSIYVASIAGVLLIAGIGNAGCSKDGNGLAEEQSHYIRIAQIDKDGTKTYSKVVKIIHE